MKKLTLLKSFLFLVLLCIPLTSLLVQAQGNVRYISDVLYVPLRAGMGNNYKIIKTALTSGTRLTLIREEIDADNNSWSLVTTNDGTEGWIRNDYLKKEPTASVKLERMSAELAKASTSVKESIERQRQHEELQKTYEALQQEQQKLVEETEHLRQLSSGALDLEKENQRAHENNQLLQTRVDVLQAENAQLKEADRYSQWLYGAGLLFCGVILSFILQGLGKRKRQSEWR